MVLKEFNMVVAGRGIINISFNLHFDSHTCTVGEIKLRADYDSGLPHRVQLKQDYGVWKLYDDHPLMEGGEVKVVPEFLNDDVSNSIAAKILRIMEEESPV